MTAANALQEKMKPYRGYRRNANQSIGLEIDKKIPLAPTVIITEQNVAELMAKHGLQVRRQSVIDVTQALSIINATVPKDEAFPEELITKANAVASALETITSDLPTLIELVDPRNEFEAFVRETLLDLEASAGKARAIVSKFRQRHPSTFWHDDAEYLHWCMGGAKTARGTLASFTKPGAPAVKFIHEAFKLAQLWHPRFDREYIPPCSAIADALDKRQKAAAESTI